MKICVMLFLPKIIARVYVFIEFCFSDLIENYSLAVRGGFALQRIDNLLFIIFTVFLSKKFFFMFRVLVETKIVPHRNKKNSL